MVVTALSFSVNVIFGSEALGCPPTNKDISDYIHLWKLISHKIGVLPENNSHEDYDTAVAGLESYLLALVKPDSSSQKASAAVLKGVADQPPFKLSFQRLSALSRCCMGDDLADALGLPPKTTADRVFVAVFKGALRLQCMIADSFPGFFARRGEKAILENLEMFLGEGGVVKRFAKNGSKRKEEGGKVEGGGEPLTRFGGYDDEERESSLKKLEEVRMDKKFQAPNS
jgi:hypothetical protein